MLPPWVEPCSPDPRADLKAMLFGPPGRGFLLGEYVGAGKSVRRIADDLPGAYLQLVWDAMVHHGIPPRGKSQAQRDRLLSGEARHPTRGKPRPEEVRKKIGDGVSRAADRRGRKGKKPEKRMTNEPPMTNDQ